MGGVRYIGPPFSATIILGGCRRVQTANMISFIQVYHFLVFLWAACAACYFLSLRRPLPAINVVFPPPLGNAFMHALNGNIVGRFARGWFLALLVFLVLYLLCASLQLLTFGHFPVLAVYGPVAGSALSRTFDAQIWAARYFQLGFVPRLPLMIIIALISFLVSPFLMVWFLVIELGWVIRFAYGTGLPLSNAAVRRRANLNPGPERSSWVPQEDDSTTWSSDSDDDGNVGTYMIDRLEKRRLHPNFYTEDGVPDPLFKATRLSFRRTSSGSDETVRQHSQTPKPHDGHLIPSARPYRRRNEPVTSTIEALTGGPPTVVSPSDEGTPSEV